MCGRFTQLAETRYLIEMFGATVGREMAPRYNVTPSDDILVCKLTPWGERVLEPMHWGLIPSWAESDQSKYRMINARAETVATKPAFRHAFRHQRCLIPADGFYEWHQNDGKQPYYIHRTDNTPLVFAGLWEHWEGKEGQVLDSCTIIVTAANRQISAIHERMPVILTPEQWQAWLDPATPAEHIMTLLSPYAGEDLDIYPVSRRVNNPRNDGEELLRRVRLQP